ncbi:MAG: hypothetical protein ABIS50_13930 [Luteolibacter sp.]|uniref:hypothetical protein n=1 Tax=Luteolibacter sp. TaxID=1962973 RepID=UPI003263E0FF
MTAAEECVKALDAIRALAELTRGGDRSAAVLLLMAANKAAGELKMISWGSGNNEGMAAVDYAATLFDEWPLLMPAMVELRAFEIEHSIPGGLGAALPVKMVPTSGSGGTRSLERNSRDSFARWILSAIHDAVFVFPQGLELGPIARKVQPRQYRTMFASAQVYLSKMIFTQDWGSAVLVKFESQNSERISRFGAVYDLAEKLQPITKDTLSEWVKVGVHWAEAACVGEWDEYPWPAGIMKRAATNPTKYSKSPRGCKAAVREWVKEGFASLTGIG